MNKLLAMVEQNFRESFARFDQLCDIVQSRGGQCSDAEDVEMRSLQTELDGMAERLQSLRETEERRMSTILPVPGDPAGGSFGSLVHVTREPELYRRDNQAEVSFFRDLMSAQIQQEPEARQRIDRHTLMMRAAGTTVTGAGVVPPTYLFEEFAIIAHGARPWADSLRKVGIENANPVNIGIQQSPGAVVAAQAGENTAPSDGNFNANVLTINPKTYTGKVDVSRQLIDGSNPAIDGIIYADAMGAYNEQIESAVVSAFEGAASYAATITYPGTAPVYANLPDAFISAAASVNKHRKMPPKVVLLSIGAWAYLMTEKDTAGRPLVTTGYSGPVNAYGIGEAAVYGQIAGTVVGLQCIPSWAQATDNHLFVAKVDDCLLLESSTFNFRYEEVLGPETIRLGVWGYAAPVVGRYAMSIAKIDGGTTIPAPAEAEAEEAPPANQRSGK